MKIKSSVNFLEMLDDVINNKEVISSVGTSEGASCHMTVMRPQTIVANRTFHTEIRTTLEI